MDAVLPFITIGLILLGLVLQILWAVRVMRAVERSARVQESLSHLVHLGTATTAIAAIARHLRGEPDPAPPRRAPNNPLNR